MVNPEQYLISAVINAKDHVTPSSKGITTKFFHSYPDEWAFLEKYIAKHRRTPSSKAFKSKFPGFKIRDVDDVGHYCDEVRAAHGSASLGSAVQEILTFMEDGDIKKATSAMHQHAMQIESQMEGDSNDSDIITNWRDTFDEVMRRVGANSELGQAGLPTGFPTLDERTGGPQAGQVWIWAARLGQGKTWSLARTACAAAFSGFDIQYDALEGTRQEIAMRIHTFASSEYGQQVFKNIDLSMGKNFSPRDYKQFLHDLRNEVKGKMHVADTTKGPISPLSIAAQIERNKVHAVFLDYIQIMDGMDSSADDWKGIGRMSKQIKQIAQRYQVPIILAAQLNREAASLRDPADPSKLAESDALGRDADAVITMKQLSKHVIVFKMAKYRHGRDGWMWYTRFLPNTGHFEEITFDEAQDAIADDKDAEVEEDYSFQPRKKGSYKIAAEKRSQANKGKNVKIKKASGGASKSTAKKRVVKRAK